MATNVVVVVVLLVLFLLGAHVVISLSDFPFPKALSFLNQS